MHRPAEVCLHRRPSCRGAYCHSVANSCPTLCNPMSLQHTGLLCPSLSPRICSNSHPLNQDAIQPSHPLSSPSSPAFNLPSIRVFSSESALCIRWPKYWIFSIRPSNEYSGFSFRIDWFDLFAIQGTLKSLHRVLKTGQTHNESSGKFGYHYHRH